MRRRGGSQIDIFSRVNEAALADASVLVERWLPDGRLRGEEYVARNPKRVDRRLGSFKINVRSGHWADFAVGAGGGDLISLYAYLNAVSQYEAAQALAGLLGVDP